jgi:hypothetical protein
MFKKGELVQLLDKRTGWTIGLKGLNRQYIPSFFECDDIAIVCKDTGTGLPIGIRMKVKENITCCFTNGETLYVLTKYVKRL